MCSAISLSKAHIVIPASIADNLFAHANQVNWVYYPSQKMLLVAAADDESFKAVHKTAMSMLKFKNTQGDRSFSVQELILDHDMDQADRNLRFEKNEQLHILSIYFE